MCLLVSQFDKISNSLGYCKVESVIDNFSADLNKRVQCHGFKLSIMH